MAYNETIVNRVRELLVSAGKVEEKKMFGGVCFMVKGKMCMGVTNDDLMCRIDPAEEEQALDRPGCRPMDFTGRPMKGYVFVSGEGIRTKKSLEYWVNLALSFNRKAKAANKNKK